MADSKIFGSRGKSRSETIQFVDVENVNLQQFCEDYLDDLCKAAPPWQHTDPQPFSGEKQIDTTIYAYANEGIKKYNQLILDREVLIDKLIDQFRSKNQEASLVKDRYTSRAKDIMDEYNLTREDKRNTYEQVKHDYEEFRRINKLNRPAVVPSSIRKVLQYFVVIFLLLGEAFANTVFFAQNLDNGLLGGFIWAFFAALANTFLAFFCAKSFKLSNLGNPIKKAFGWFMLPVFILGVTHLAFFISHIRNGLQKYSVDEVWDHIWENGFYDLGNLPAVVLFGVTLIIGVIAFFDVYYMDDVCPGYTERQVLYNKVLDELEEENNILREDIKEVKEKHIKILDDNLRQAESLSNNITKAINEKESFIIQGNNLRNQYKELRTSAITTYRHRRGDYVSAPDNTYPFDLPAVDTKTAISAQRRALEELDRQYNDLFLTAEMNKQEIVASYHSNLETINKRNG